MISRNGTIMLLGCALVLAVVIIAWAMGVRP